MFIDRCGNVEGIICDQVGRFEWLVSVCKSCNEQQRERE
jgi:hypothetical protein